MNPYEYETTLDCRDVDTRAGGGGGGGGGGVGTNGGGTGVGGMMSLRHNPTSTHSHQNTLQHQNQQNLQLQQQQHLQQQQSPYDYEYQHLPHRAGELAAAATANNSGAASTAQRNTHGRPGYLLEGVTPSAPPDVPPRNPTMSRMNNGRLVPGNPNDLGVDFEPSCLVRTPSGNVYIPSGNLNINKGSPIDYKSGSACSTPTKDTLKGYERSTNNCMGPVLPPRSVMSGLPAHHYSTPMNFRKGLAARWHRWRCALNICLAVFALLGLISIVLYVSGVLHLSMDEPRTILVGNEASEVTAAKSTNTDLTKFGQATTVTASTATSSLSSISASQAAAAQAASGSADIMGNGGGGGGGTLPSSTAYQSPASASSAVAAIGTTGAIASSPSSSSLANANNGDIRNEVLPMPGRRAAWPSPVRGYAYTPQQKWQQQTKDSAATGTHLSIGAQRYERRRQRQQQQQRNSDGVAVVASSDDKWQWQWQNYRQNTYQQQKQRQEQAFVKVQTPFNAVRQQHGARKKRYRRSLMTDQAFESIDLITRTHTKADDQMKAYENNINNTYNRKHKLENGNNFNVDKAKDSSDSNGDDSELLNVGKSEVADSFEVTQTTIPKAVELKLTNDNVIELVAQPAVVGNLVDTNERTKENELQESNKATVGETKEPKPLTDAKTRNHMTAESSALHKYQTLKLSNTQTASNYAATALSQQALEIPLVFENITKARTVYDRNNSNNTPNGNRTARGGNVSAAKTLQINNVLNLNQNTNNDKEIAAATKTGVESAATQTSGSEIVAPAKTFAYDDDVSDGQQNNATLTTNAKVLSKAFMDKNNEVTNLTSDDEANAACGNDERNAYAASTSKCAGATTKLFEGDAIEDASTKPTPTASRPNIDLTTSDIHDIFGGDIDYVEGDTQREVRDSQAEFVKKVEGREEFIFKTATEINEISITTAATPGASVERMRTESVKVTAEEGAQTTAYKQVKTNLRVRKTNEPRYMKTLRKHFGRPIHAPVLPAAAAVQFLNVVINDDSQIDRPPVEEVQQEEIPQRNWQEEMHSNNTGISAVQSGKNIAVSDDFQIDGYATKKSENNVSENVHNADAHGTTTRHQEFEEANDSQINRHNGATDNTLSDSESDTNEAATDDNNNERDLVDSYDDVGYAARPQATPLPADTSSVIKIDKSELNEEKEWQRAAYDNVETRTETRVADEVWQSGRAATESELEIKLNESQMQNEAAAMIEKHIAIVGVDADVEETTTTTTTKLMITADERQTMEINERASVARNEAGESDKQLAAETRDVQKSNVLVLGYGNKKEGEVADLLPLENVEDDSISAEEEAGVVTLRTTSVTGHTQMSDKQADEADAAQTTEKPNSNNAKERESDEVESQTHTTTIQLTLLSRNQKNPSTAVVDESNSEDELMLNDGLMPQHNNKQPINHNAPDNIIKRNRNFNSNSNAYAPTNDYQHFIAEPNADDIDIIKLEDTHSSEDEIYKTIEGAAREKPKYTYGKRKEIITSRPPRYPSHAENEILKGGVESNAANNYTDKLQPFPLKAPIVSESYDPPSKHILVNVTIATEGDSNSVYTLHVAVPIGGQSHDVQEVLTHERLKTRDHEEHAEEQPTISPYCIPEPPPPIPECPCKCADFLTVTEAADSVDNEEHFVPIEDLDETANFVHTDTATATTTAPNTTDNFIHPPFSPIAATTATMLTNTVNATEDSFISTTTTATFTNLLGVDAAHAASVDDHVVVGDGSKIACPDVMPILILEGDCF